MYDGGNGSSVVSLLSVVSSSSGVPSSGVPSSSPSPTSYSAPSSSGTTSSSTSKITASSTFVIPPHLRLLPTDDDPGRAKKRKQVKALKQKFKSVKSEARGEEKKMRWNDFQTGKGKGGKKKRKLKGVGGESIFGTREEGGEDRGVTTYENKKRFKLS